ncbi:multidrug effflux MFS transporter [Altererythrobacter sp. B11]|uniref:multidrug effflux MFS transporter n=1 Tax=Altererythrobacter sp. B11 TaxID=2060312 RepID=UPI000E5BB3D4|nr:multidrug effflux MFS transporter [Altererythrobacter sp. B11]
MATRVAPHEMPMIGQRELVLLIALLMSLSALAIDGMLPALDEIAREMGVAEGNQRQLVVAVYLLANGVGTLLPGSLADRLGRRPVLLGTLALFALLSVVVTLVHSFEALLVVRGLQGLAASGLMVVPYAIIRDQYEGDGMARLMSLVGAVFIAVPVVAPSLGQGVLLIAGWRWIFFSLAGCAALGALWVWARLPETLHPEYRQKIDVPVILRNMGVALFNRAAIGYVLGTSLLIGAVFGYVNSAQQLIGEHFGAGKWFPVVFGGTAAMMVVSNIVNARIVERFGARRVSHTGVLVFIVVSCLQVWAAHYHDGEIALFLPLMAINLGLLGFLGANFGSIAMQPFASIAGAASSIQSFFRMFGAAVVGLVIGQAYDGTARPFAHALLICSVLALALVLFSEKGVLFRRLNGPKPAAAE